MILGQLRRLRKASSVPRAPGTQYSILLTTQKLRRPSKAAPDSFPQNHLPDHFDFSTQKFRRCSPLGIRGTKLLLDANPSLLSPLGISPAKHQRLPHLAPCAHTPTRSGRTARLIPFVASIPRIPFPPESCYQMTPKKAPAMYSPNPVYHRHSMLGGGERVLDSALCKFL